MKVIQGSLKGRLLACPAGIRPASLMVKKACFDILRGEVEGSRVLDLFAGTGALGIEAISLGAKETVFIDNNGQSVDAIQKNITALNIAGKASVYQKDAFLALPLFVQRHEVFDIVFLDPPYHQGTLRKILHSLGEYDIVAPSRYIVALCYDKDEFTKENGLFSLICEKKYGQNLLLIYKKKELPKP